MLKISLYAPATASTNETQSIALLQQDTEDYLTEKRQVLLEDDGRVCIMRKALCVNKHYFDADRFNMCPICGSIDYQDLSIYSGNSSDPEQTEKPKKLQDTEPASHISRKGDSSQTPKEDAEAKDGHDETVDDRDDTASLKDAIEKTGSTSRKELPKTITKWDLDDTTPPVGWLVGIVGPHLGEAFACSSGRNRIGRADSMEIILSKDPEITRESQAVLVYEPNSRKFYIQAGESRGIVYLNEAPVISYSELQAYDKLKLGRSEFVFLPLCGEHFTWDDYMNKGKSKTC